MGRKRHLKLVYSNDAHFLKERKKTLLQLLFLHFSYFKYIFVPRKEKIQALRNIIQNMYRDFEISSGTCEIPYYIRTENKINQIIQENKINYYYLRLKKFQSYMNSL